MHNKLLMFGFLFVVFTAFVSVNTFADTEKKNVVAVGCGAADADA